MRLISPPMRPQQENQNSFDAETHELASAFACSSVFLRPHEISGLAALLPGTERRRVFRAHRGSPGERCAVYRNRRRQIARHLRQDVETTVTM